jgi:MYXO-CTERM domain-containing protein
MTINFPSSLSRLFARARRLALAAALVAASAPIATAAPLTASYGFGLNNSTIAAFDTTLGTLLGIDITLDAGLSAINTLSDGGTAVGTCMASFIGGSYTVSAPGGSPTLVSLTGDGNVNFACAQFEVALTKHTAVSLSSSLFGTFSSAGVSPITLVQNAVGAGGLIVRGAGSTIANGVWDSRLTSGTVAYTYCPVGDTCTSDPTPTAIPEPATATMLALGLAGLVARRRRGEL